MSKVTDGIDMTLYSSVDRAAKFLKNKQSHKNVGFTASASFSLVSNMGSVCLCLFSLPLGVIGRLLVDVCVCVCVCVCACVRACVCFDTRFVRKYNRS